MNLFKRIWQYITGNNKEQKDIIPAPSATGYLERWEQERQKRIAAAEVVLKPWLSAKVKEKGELSFKWESGGDEAFVTFDNKNEDEENLFFDLEGYIIDKLDIPDAGEFTMTGNGVIYSNHNEIRVRYSSVLRGIIDFDEEKEEEIYGEEEKDNADIILFTN